MKKFINSFSSILFVLFFCLLFSKQIHAKDNYEWLLDKEHARIQYINTETGEPVRSTFMDITGYTYYFDDNGYAATGFTKIDGFYYFFRSDGSMIRKEWCADRYFLQNGRMAVNRFINDGTGRKYIGNDGRWIPGFKKTRKAKFIKTKQGTKYRNLDGTYSSATWQCIKGKWYYFYSSGYMAKNTKLGKFYVNGKGQMVTNKWVKIKKFKYYYGPDGRLLKKQRIKNSSAAVDKVVTIS